MGCKTSAPLGNLRAVARRVPEVDVDFVRALAGAEVVDATG